jgi:hypothetical protein
VAKHCRTLGEQLEVREPEFHLSTSIDTINEVATRSS